MPLSLSISSHSAVVRVRVSASINASSSIRFRTRAPFVANFSLDFHSGLPSLSQSTPNSRSLPPPSKISPSRVLKPLYGTIEANKFSQKSQSKGALNIRCAVPHRPLSGCPLINAELAIFASVATWQSLSATSICCPFPVLALPSNAAKIEFEV